jgi:hypothetical protein
LSSFHQRSGQSLFHSFNLYAEDATDVSSGRVLMLLETKKAVCFQQLFANDDGEVIRNWALANQTAHPATATSNLF